MALVSGVNDHVTSTETPGTFQLVAARIDVALRAMGSAGLYAEAKPAYAGLAGGGDDDDVLEGGWQEAGAAERGAGPRRRLRLRLIQGQEQQQRRPVEYHQELVRGRAPPS